MRFFKWLLTAMGFAEEPAPEYVKPKAPLTMWLLIAGPDGLCDYWPGGMFTAHLPGDGRLEIHQNGQREVAATYKEWHYFKHVMRSRDDVDSPADLEIPFPYSSSG